MWQRTRGALGRLVTDPPSPWLAVPVGFSLSVLVAAAFGGDGSLVPFALYVLAMTVIGFASTRSAVAGENVALSSLAFICGAVALGFLLSAVQEVTRPGRPSVLFLVILLAAATPSAVFCGCLVHLIVTFQRRMHGEPAASNEAASNEAASNEATPRQM